MKPIACLLYLAGILLVVSCAVPREPPTLAPGFSEREVRRVGLAPVIFRDEPIDRYYARRIAGNLLEETRKTLEAKGYTVIPAGDQTAIFPLREEEPGPFPLPAAAQALLTVEIDHFLDAALYDRESPQSLDVYATGTLTSPSGEILWKDSATARGTRFGGSPGGLEIFSVPADLADSLFATLPPA